jgi:hypothetical protein
MEYHIVKRVLTRRCIPLVRSSCYLGVLPRHDDVGGDRMDSLLKRPVPGAHGFLLLHHIVAGA